ncbi:MAG TPA: penicillin acylase family protein [Myxococcaceae bacterium]|jgi:acyl-homoserine-lactone acylase
MPRGTAQGQSVDLTEACAVLAAWNGRFDAEVAGPPLWREFIDAFGPGAQTQAGALFATPFSVQAPLETPNTLVSAPASGTDPVLDRLAAAVLTLKGAGMAVTRLLGEVQFTPRAGQHVPVHGGLAQDGVINVVNYNLNLMTSLEPPTPRGTVLNSRTGLTADGYVINGGTSFLLATEFVDGGVRARALLTYGQHGNPASPAFRDQLTLFANKQWRNVAFTEEEIATAPGYETRTLTHD